MIRSSKYCATAYAFLLLVATSAAAQSTDRTSSVSLDSLLHTQISTASKYLQTSAEAGASITIVSHEEIQRLGYRNLQEVLESVPGMYVGNDRNYTSLGTRGFGRPSDYNNRILMLVDGHTLNEPVWGSAPVGADLPLSLDAIERVEVVRGPGSALYGSNALFCVINIVTRTGEQLDGAHGTVQLASGNQHQASAVVGYPLGTHGAFAVSALTTKSDGNALYFPEFDTPANNNGIVRNLDWENATGVLGSLVVNGITTHVGYRTRSKGVPTASYLRQFGDARSRTKDETFWGDLGAHRDIGVSYHLSGRVYADQSSNLGSYPFSNGPAFQSGLQSSVIGAESILLWDPTSRNRLTVGTEYRKALHAEYFDESLMGQRTSDNRPFSIASLFAQDEWQVASGIKLIGGLRYDKEIGRWHSLTPRVALIATPDHRTTIKLLYGSAYRAPSAGEAEIETSYIHPDHNLKPERAATGELAFERRVTSSVLVGASLYRYDLENLIEPATADTVAGVRSRNAAESDGTGIELTLNVQPLSMFSIRGWYALQKTTNDSTHEALVNSPQQIFNVAGLLSASSHLQSGITLHHETGRLMIRGGSTPAFTRVDANVEFTPASGNARRWMRQATVSFRASNLFDTNYSVPAGVANLQNALAQDGRTLLVRFALAY